MPRPIVRFRTRAAARPCGYRVVVVVCCARFACVFVYVHFCFYGDVVWMWCVLKSYGGFIAFVLLSVMRLIPQVQLVLCAVCWSYVEAGNAVCACVHIVLRDQCSVCETGSESIRGGGLCINRPWSLHVCALSYFSFTMLWMDIDFTPNFRAEARFWGKGIDRPLTVMRFVYIFSVLCTYCPAVYPVKQPNYIWNRLC